MSEVTSTRFTAESHASEAAKRARTKPRAKPERQPVPSHDDVDARLHANRRFLSMKAAISSEMTGGVPDHLDTMQRHLVAAFCGCALELDALTASLLVGRDIDPIGYASIAATMVNLSERLSDSTRRPRPSERTVLDSVLDTVVTLKRPASTT
jgi:hypothetical protein